MNDLDEQLGYDADHDDPRQFCEHGTFIGSWWGPDYLCGACEMGYSQLLDRYFKACQSARQAAEQRPLFWRKFCDHWFEIPWNSAVATHVVRAMLDDHDEIVQALRWERECKARVRWFLWKHGDQIRREEQEMV